MHGHDNLSSPTSCKKTFSPRIRGEGRGGEGSDSMVHDRKVLRGVDLQCDRENREHLKYLRSVKCVMTNHSKYQDT